MSPTQLKQLKVYFNKCSSVKQLVLKYYTNKFPLVKNEKELLDTIVDMSVVDLKNKSGRIKDVIEQVKKQKLWGFCRINKRENIRNIYYWCSDDIELRDLTELLSHELAHSIGIISEKVAMQYGFVSSCVIQLIMSMYKNKLKKKGSRNETL